MRILRREPVPSTDLSASPTSGYVGETLHLFWFEQESGESAILVEAVIDKPQEYFTEMAANGQPAVGLVVELPEKHEYLGLKRWENMFEKGDKTWWLAKGPLPIGAIDASKYPKLEVGN